MYWVNTGAGISTRQAQEALKSIDTFKEVDSKIASELTSAEGSANTIHDALRERIISIVNHHPLTTENRPTVIDVFLFPTGMAAIYRIHRYILAKYQPIRASC